jgi:triosephosphate isomerase
MMAGNWKMNKTPSEAASFIQSIKTDLLSMTQVERVVCPPYLAIPAVHELLKDTDIRMGAQDIHWKDSGAYTSCISAPMLKGWVEYVIIGHSETREYLGVTDEQVNLKIKAALTHGLKPIFAFGESLAQNQHGETAAVCERQLQAGLADITPEQMLNIILAYEPIWAIGTGVNATPEQAQEIIGGVVRQTIKKLYGEAVAQQVRILYGGSMNGANCGDLMKQPDIDGGLIGGASLKTEYVDMVRTSIAVKGLA